MKIKIVPIGNSKGIRIPKALLQQCHLRQTVEIEPHPDGLLIRPSTRPRKGWDAAFQTMERAGDDQLLDQNAMAAPRWENKEWEW